MGELESGLDLEELQAAVVSAGHSPRFLTVSGSHLYGFPSVDSDVDLRGCHLLPLDDVIGLKRSRETVELVLEVGGREVELVSHDLAKYLRLLLRHNGYVLEQIFSPIVVSGQAFLDRLRVVAGRCITRLLYHHYRGFLGTQLRLLEKEEPKRAKTVLYMYRVALTGIHVLTTGEVEANLPRLLAVHPMAEIDALIERKRSGETIALDPVEWPRHRENIAHLERLLQEAFEASRLPEEVPLEEANSFLVEIRRRG